MSATKSNHKPLRIEEICTLLIGILVLVAAGTGVFVPGFYDSVVDPRYITGTITADLISLICVPLLIVCMFGSRRGSRVADLIWVALLVYTGYAYAVYAFDRMYTMLFPAYMAIFGLSCFVVVSILARLKVNQLAEYASDLRLRRTTAIFLVFTGIILYIIELPIILSRIPGDIQSGGTPFMVLDMSIVAPVSILTGIWLWQRRPWGAVLTAVFLIKAITIMTSFLIADYIEWFAGRSTWQGETITFTVVYLLVYFFTWNYFSAFNKKKKLDIQTA
jgi:hypothetical protein